VIPRLVRLADELDRHGRHEEADAVDRVLRRLAADPAERSMRGYAAVRISDIFEDLEAAGWEREKVAEACRDALGL